MDYMLAHGADINAGFPDQSPVQGAALCGELNNVIVGQTPGP